MKCRNCPEGRRFAKGSVNCIRYGMIIRENHECGLEGGRRHDGDQDHGEEKREETGLQEDGRGAA